jgi:hypothetical protein
MAEIAGMNLDLAFDLDIDLGLDHSLGGKQKRWFSS